MKRAIGIIMLALVIASCDDHMPRGILVEKEYQEGRTTVQYQAIIPKYKTITIPERWVFLVQCDSCHRVHHCNVEKETFDKYNVGDSVSAKSYYYGKENKQNK